MLAPKNNTYSKLQYRNVHYGGACQWRYRTATVAQPAIASSLLPTSFWFRTPLRSLSVYNGSVGKQVASSLPSSISTSHIHLFTSSHYLPNTSSQPIANLYNSSPPSHSTNVLLRPASRATPAYRAGGMESPIRRALPNMVSIPTFSKAPDRALNTSCRPGSTSTPPRANRNGNAPSQHHPPDLPWAPHPMNCPPRQSPTTKCTSAWPRTIPTTPPTPQRAQTPTPSTKTPD